VPEYFAVLQEGGEAPKVVVYFKIIRKRDSNFFAASIGLRIETTDFYLIRARRMAQLVGLERRKQKPYLQRNHTFSRFGRLNPGRDPQAVRVIS
jgi:hypothetical protein